MKFIIPKMKETFGVLEFAGMGDSKFDYVNGRRKETFRQYNLYSSVQRADNVAVYIPAGLRLRNFDYEQRIQLVNPRILVVSYRVGERDFTDYVLYADDIVPYGNEVED